MSSRRRCGCVLLACWLVADLARAHEPASLDASSLRASWTANGWLLAMIAGASALYLRGHRARARSAQTGAAAAQPEAHARAASPGAQSSASPRRAPGGLEAAAFALAMLTLLLALVSPLDRLSDLLFSAHMVQHELLMLLAAPLLVLARPLPTYLWALPGRVRARLARALRQPQARRGFRMLTGPLFVLFLHGAIRWLWHARAPFEAALRDEWIHGLQHASFFFSALLFWWALIHGRYGRSGYGVSVLFVLLTGLHTGGLGALLAFTEHAWYPSYVREARAYGLDPIADQQLAGLIMWIVAGAWLMLLGLSLALAWLGEARRHAARGHVAALLRAHGGER